MLVVPIRIYVCMYCKRNTYYYTLSMFSLVFVCTYSVFLVETVCLLI